MPYYKITVKLRKKKSVTGIRELDRANIDYAWRYFQNKIYQEYRQSEVLTLLFGIKTAANKGIAYVPTTSTKQ